MYGRNGVDQLGLTSLWTAIVLDVVNLFIKNKTAYAILSSIALVITGMGGVPAVFQEPVQAPGRERAVHEQGGVPHAPGPVPQSG